MLDGLVLQVTMMLSDQGGTGPEVRSTTASFSVRVLDVNDNLPVFTAPVCPIILITSAMYLCHTK